MVILFEFSEGSKQVERVYRLAVVDRYDVLVSAVQFLINNLFGILLFLDDLKKYDFCV